MQYAHAAHGKAGSATLSLDGRHDALDNGRGGETPPSRRFTQLVAASSGSDGGGRVAWWMDNEHRE